MNVKLLTFLGAIGAATATSVPKPTTTPTATATPIATVGTATSNATTTTVNPKEYHMKPVKVIHARVQSDAPLWNATGKAFVSRFGDSLEHGYRAAMDTVNTASVDGALMYVQAEGINVKSRSEVDRCVRKNKMNYVVFYEITLAQTNETLAEFQNNWETPEYGPMLPMDGGKCTALDSNKMPKECYEFNGDKGTKNLGPFIGGGSKTDDPRAPYPGNYWFSFPNTCPLVAWGTNKTESCRGETRKGLCDFGKQPDGVECTFAYKILGWIPIDDVVGITSIPKADNSAETYRNFTEWCLADDSHVEFSGNDKTGKMDEGLPFWDDPTNSTRNQMRSDAMVQRYQELVKSGKSPQVDAKDLANFKILPTPQELAKTNPPCFYSVKSCGTGNGCKRETLSQFCRPCNAAEKCDTTDASKFTFPELAPAKPKTTTKSTDASGSIGGSILSQSGSGMAGGTSNKQKKSSTASKAGSKQSSASQLAVISLATAIASVAASALML